MRNVAQQERRPLALDHFWDDRYLVDDRHVDVKGPGEMTTNLLMES